MRLHAPPRPVDAREDLDRLVVGAAAVARWLLLPAHAVAGTALALRRRRLAGAAGALALAQLVLGARALGRGRPDAAVPGAAPLRLVTANLLLDNADVAAVGRALAGCGADVLCLQELTPAHLDALRAGGLLDALPHAVLDPRPGYHGSAVLSRWPLRGEVLDVVGLPVAAAEVDTPAGPLRVVAVHVVNPVSRTPGAPRTWRAQLAELGRHAGLALERGVPVVLAGDWNATLDHAPLRALLRRGLRDAHRVAGRGPGFSWPHWPSHPLPPLMRIDHVLVSDALGVRRAVTVPTRGSDHRRVVVDLELVPA